MGLNLIQLVVTQPTPTVTTGSVFIVVNTPTGEAAPTAPVYVGGALGVAVLSTIATGYYLSLSGIAPGVYTVLFSDSGSPALTLFVTFGIYGPPEVDSTPPALAAAHIPLMAVIRAAPIVQPDSSLQPSAILVCIDVASGSGWLEIARARQSCDATLNSARFDFSEYVKTQFTQTPPDETGGPDPALAVRYRVRYGNASSGYTGVAGTEAGTFGGLAVNAAQVVNPAADPLPLTLGPTLPYASVPVGYARFQNVINADGTAIISSDTVPENSADWPCAVRQFVWLDAGGFWAWGFFTGRHEHGTETADGLLVRTAGGVEKYVSRGDVRRTLRVYSDKLDFATFQVLVGIRDSIQVWERLITGAYVPVVVEPGSFKDWQETDKIFNVDFLARYPVLVRQTQ